MSEWLKEHAWKSVYRVTLIEGSNPSLTAIIENGVPKQHAVLFRISNNKRKIRAFFLTSNLLRHLMLNAILYRYWSPMAALVAGGFFFGTVFRTHGYGLGGDRRVHAFGRACVAFFNISTEGWAYFELVKVKGSSFERPMVGLFGACLQALC